MTKLYEDSNEIGITIGCLAPYSCLRWNYKFWQVTWPCNTSMWPFNKLHYRFNIPYTNIFPMKFNILTIPPYSIYVSLPLPPYIYLSIYLCEWLNDGDDEIVWGKIAWKVRELSNEPPWWLHGDGLVGELGRLTWPCDTSMWPFEQTTWLI